MKTLEIHGNTGDSTILLGESIKNLQEYIPTRVGLIITDNNVKHYYSKHFPPYDVIEIGTGEEIKNLETVRNIYEKLLKLGADRSSFIVAIGGGIVCDIAGFVASTYLRGLKFGFVSTTLLSQADASIGGKNGVNLGGYKNMVGVFSQPKFVICDTNLLKSLPRKEILCGLAEIVKQAAVGDINLFSYIEKHYQKALNLDSGVIEKLVYDSLILKSSIVNKDEREEGGRMVLNFGHTFGHAIEKNLGVPHGEAISAGMVMAATLSEKRGYLKRKDTERIVKILDRLGLPTRVRFDKKGVVDALRRDKKRSGESISFVLLKGIGKAIVEEIPIKELNQTIDQMNQS